MHRPQDRFLITVVLVAIGALFLPRPAYAEEHSRHRVVFEVTVDGAEQWQSILNNVENLQKAFGPTQTELAVVAHGKGLGLLLATNTDIQERLARIAQSGVTLAACENTMRRLQVSKSDLFPFVTTVDSGVAEVVRKQEAGWAYIKGGM